MFPPYQILPATCELCGNWLPDHQASCPRNGVHPSQWALGTNPLGYQLECALEQQQQQQDDDDDDGICIKVRQ